MAVSFICVYTGLESKLDDYKHIDTSYLATHANEMPRHRKDQGFPVPEHAERSGFLAGLFIINQLWFIVIPFLRTQWLLTPTDSVNKSHHELLTPPDHVKLCTHFRVTTSMVGAQVTKG